MSWPFSQHKVAITPWFHRIDSGERLAINPERVQGLQVSICCCTQCTIAMAPITTMAAMTWCR
jgi:hypothetical protein